MVTFLMCKVTGSHFKKKPGHFNKKPGHFSKKVILTRNRVILTKKPGHLKSNRKFFCISSITRPHLRILKFNYKLVPQEGQGYLWTPWSKQRHCPFKSKEIVINGKRVQILQICLKLEKTTECVPQLWTCTRVKELYVQCGFSTNGTA